MRRKILKLSLSLAAVFIFGAAMLNIQVSTKQGVNYQVSTLKLPLYIKVLGFFDRHYNYKLIAKRIIDGSREEEEKALKIFKWTHENIRKTPEGYPVVDDHVWHIIVRGYGEDDQSSDVFAALCNYAGMDAFYNWIYAQNDESHIVLSFVRVNGKWCVFDPYNGVYFKSKSGGIATIDEIKIGEWAITNIGQQQKNKSDYEEFAKNLSSVKEIGLNRANIQSPLRRLIYEINKWMKQR
ncbi:MAG: transglutaminase domain-containing protein [Candidatus Omnitrophica bacterium]|nr:transglutaminase domain-containing protein [Candidatus Omnitrophota bacterium]